MAPQPERSSALPEERKATEDILEELVDRLAERIAEKLDERRRLDALADIVLERLEGGGVTSKQELRNGSRKPPRRKTTAEAPAKPTQARGRKTASTE